MRLNVGLVAIMLLLSSAALAQSTYGAFKGTIADPSGAVVKDAEVQAVNANTGVLRSVKTNAEGFFRLANLDSGIYKSLSVPLVSRAPNKRTWSYRHARKFPSMCNCQWPREP